MIRPDYLEMALEADAEAAIGGGCVLRGLLDACPAPWAAVAALIELGAERAVLGQLAGAGDLGLAQVSIGRDGRFAFGGPDRRLILGVRVWGELIDLVALSSSNEQEWALYRGAVDFLGEDALDRAVACELREVRLHSTPFDWLRGGWKGRASSSGAVGRQAICVLDWSTSALAALRGLPQTTTLICDPGTGDRLKGLLAFGGLPIVAEHRPRMRRAA